MKGGIGTYLALILACQTIMKLGQVTITEAELIAVREGLKIVWNRCVEKLVTECDSRVVVQLIKKADTNIHLLGNIIEDYRELIKK
ncbi:hypothetical protein ACJIZ3_008091 [Penstemon smallii]|uniref:RNase H type-1 domain-containing protein n=1 Tax=Penstemon smallii TaxID=265156 RepID=A0ABD3T9H6_9LAMI